MAEVFISHSSKDAVIAQNLCGILEQNGISCWMAPRNIMPGDDWATAITKAITTTKVFIIIYSANSAASTEVPKEIMLAGSRHSYIIPYKIDDTPLRENFEYHLGASHWISADIARGDYKAAELLAAVNCGLGNGAPAVSNVVTVNNYGAGTVPAAQAVPTAYAAPPAAAPAAKKQNKLLPVIIASAAAVLVAVIALVSVLAGGSDGDDERDRSSSEAETIETEERQDKDEQGEDKDEAPQAVLELYAYDSYNVTQYKGRSDEFLVFGKKYNTGYAMSEYEAWMMFNVEGCTEVTFTVGRIDGSGSEDRELVVYLDGNEYDSYTITLDAAETITVPLADAKTMKLYAGGNVYKPQLGIYDLEFIGAASETDDKNEQDQDRDEASEDILELYAYDSYNTTEYKGRSDEFLIFGEKYNTGYVMSELEAWAIFNVEGCTEVTFTVGRIDGSGSEDRELAVYLDGNEYDSYTITPNAVETITVPLAEAKTMKLYARGNVYKPQLGIYDVSFSGTPVQEAEEQELIQTAYKGHNHTEYMDGRSQFLVMGKGHSYGYSFTFGESWVIFNVNGFTEVSFTMGRIDNTGLNSRDVYIYLDGREYDCVNVSPEAELEYTVPINGAGTMQLYCKGNGSAPCIGFYDFVFDGGYEPICSETETACDAVMYDSYNITEHGTVGSFYVYGEPHKGYTMSIAESWALFNVNGCSELSFTAATTDASNFNSRPIIVLVDGIKYKEYTIVPFAPTDIVIPLDGAKIVELRSGGNGNYPEVALFNVGTTGEKTSIKQANAPDCIYAPENMFEYTYENVDVMNGQSFLICGESHEYGFVSEQVGEFKLTFNVDGYTEFGFAAARLDDTAVNPRKFDVYVDGVKSASYTVSFDVPPVEAVIPLDGAKTVEIIGESGNGLSPKIAFYNVHFKK